MDRQCPMCGLEHSFFVTFENIGDVYKLGVDPEPIRKMLVTEDAKAIEKDGSCYMAEDWPARRPLPGEPGFIEYLRGDPHEADQLDGDDLPDPGIHDADDRTW